MEELINAIKKNSFFGKNKLLVLDSLLIIWVFYVLFPLLGIGFVSDDAYNSQILGKSIFDGSSIWEEISIEIKKWLFESGRFSPFAWLYTYGLYSLQPSPFVVKSITLAIIAVNVLFYSKIVHFITKDRNLSYLCAFIVPLLFQFRLWHDPIMAFTFMIPMLSLFLFTSLFLLIKYLEKNEAKTITLFIFLYILSLCTYELSYIFIIFYILIILFSSSRRGWWKPFLLVVIATSAHLLILIFYRDSNESIYPGSNLNFDYEVVLSALLVQVTSAFPLSWKLAAGAAHESLSKLTYSVLIVFSIFSLVITDQFYKLKDGFSVTKASIKLLIFSLALLLLPAVPIALTGHQNELVKMGFGYAYIVVFIQYFGSVALFLTIIYFIKNRYFFKNRETISFFFIFLVILSIGYFTRQENSFVAHEVNKFYKYPRDLIKKSINSGILDHISSNSLLLRNERYPSDHLWFYTMKMGRKINICGLNLEKEFPKCLNNQKDLELYGLYGLAYFMSSDLKAGSVFVAKLDRIVFFEGVLIGMNFKDYKVYNSRTNKLSEVKSDKIYDLLKIADFEVGATILDYSLEDFEKKEVSLAFKSFYPKEGTRDSYLRWSSGSSMILIENNSDIIITKRLTLALIRPATKSKPASVSITHVIDGSKGFLEMSRYFVYGKKEISMILNLKPGMNFVKFKSDSPHIDNGDPRNIVFGIANYSLDSFKVE